MNLINKTLVVALFTQVYAESPLEKDKESTSPLVVEVVAHKVDYDKDNNEVLVEAEKALPGDVIRVNASYLNNSQTVLNSVTPELAVPEGTALQEGSIKPEPNSVKIDEAYLNWPLTAEELETYTYADIDSVKWNVDALAPESLETFQFQIVVK